LAKVILYLLLNQI